MSDYVSKLQDYLREKRIDGEIIEVRKASTVGDEFHLLHISTSDIAKESEVAKIRK